MKKNFFSWLVSLIIMGGGINLILSEPIYAHITQEISVYSVTYNNHGRVVKTSVGTFYIGKSGDVIFRNHSGEKIYGYWQQRSSVTYVYVGDDVYYFSF